MKKRGIALIFLLSILLSVNVQAISIAPSSIRIEFTPNYEESFVYQTERAANAAVLIEGELAEYFTVEKNNIEKDGTFIVKAKLPEVIETPGDNVVFISIVERSADGGMISAMAAIRSPIVIRVPFPGIHAEFKFNVYDLNINQTKDFSISIKNLGKLDINNVKSEIEIFNTKNQVVEKLNTDEKPIKAGSSGTIKATFDASKHTAGTYKAIAYITYDEDTRDIERYFKIGTLTIDIVNYTKTFNVEDNVAKFEIEAESRWNNLIKEIFATVKITNNSVYESNFKTITFNLEPWEKKKISTFWDKADVAKGTYDVEIILNYDGKTTVKKGKIEVVNNKKSSAFASLFATHLTTTNLLIILVILLIVINVIILMRKNKPKSSLTKRNTKTKK